jgi:hypothetical protein
MQEIEIEIETAQKTNMFGRSYCESDWDVTSVGGAAPAICCRCVILTKIKITTKRLEKSSIFIYQSNGTKPTGNDVLTMLG